MKSTVKVKKKKLNLLKTLLILLTLYVISYGAYSLINVPIKHTRVLNNNIIKDQEILELANIDDYPSFFLTSQRNIIRRLKSNDLIKEVAVEKKWGFRIDIKVKENNILFYNQDTNTLILENKKEIPSHRFINHVPILINYVPDIIYDTLISKMLEIDESVKIKISSIQYKPNDVDKELFLLTLNDGNYIYLTLYTFEKLNEYNNILPSLENKKGILYLDSGNYFEILK